MFTLRRRWYGLLMLFCLLSSLTAPCSGQTLMAKVTLDLSNPPVWSYTLQNLEDSTSGNWISGFFLPIFAPVTNVQAPDFWTVDTDFTTYVNWQNTESAPFPHDIPPGGTLSGFSFESVAGSEPVEYELFSYDHIRGDLGPNGFGPTLAPSNRVQGVPEPGIVVSLNVLAGATILALQRLRQCRSHPRRNRQVP
jgi:hypothetical protein